MNQMKRIIILLAAAVAFLASCQDEITLNPAASLFSDKPELKDETAIFRLAVANVADSSQAVVFPVRFEGTAERGTDYSVSADAFVFGGESPVEAITVTTLKRGTDKTLSLILDLPEGFDGGRFLSAGYTLHDKYAYISFDNAACMLADSLDLPFKLTDREGRTRSISKEAKISLSVNKEKSTAVEGEDFMFADSSWFTVPAGNTGGSFKLESLKPSIDPGRDKLVLGIGVEDSEGFGSGEITEIEISLLDQIWGTLEGKWKIDTLITDSLYMKEIWKENCSGYSLMPEFNKRDAVSFDLLEGTFSPSFRSSFSNYFIGESTMHKGGLQEIRLDEDNSVTLQTFLLDNTNRYFSKNEKSEDTESLIGLRLVQEEEEEILEMYLIDHTSKSFMPELEADGKYAPEKPAAASPGLYLRLGFTKE